MYVEKIKAVSQLNEDKEGREEGTRLHCRKYLRIRQSILIPLLKALHLLSLL
jgi:hypothetical protein